jgi:hypothetical protein
MSATEITAEASRSVANLYACAYRRELESKGITNRPKRSMTADRVNRYLVQPIRMCTIQQQANLARAGRWAAAQNLERARQLEGGIRVSIACCSNSRSAGRLHAERIQPCSPGNGVSPWELGQGDMCSKCSKDIGLAGVCKF